MSLDHVGQGVANRVEACIRRSEAHAIVINRSRFQRTRERWQELSAAGSVDGVKTVAAMVGPITAAVGAVLAPLG